MFELPGGLGAWGFNPPVDEHDLLTGGREFWSGGSALLLQPPDQFQQDQHPYEMRVICIPVQCSVFMSPIVLIYILSALIFLKINVKKLPRLTFL